MKLTIELEVVEAQMILDPITDRQLSASRLAATATDPELREVHDLTAKILGRVATRITDAIYPGCAYVPGDDEACGKDYAGMFSGHAYCAFHLSLMDGSYRVALA